MPLNNTHPKVANFYWFSKFDPNFILGGLNIDLRTLSNLFISWQCDAIKNANSLAKLHKMIKFESNLHFNKATAQIFLMKI